MASRRSDRPDLDLDAGWDSPALPAVDQQVSGSPERAPSASRLGARTATTRTSSVARGPIGTSSVNTGELDDAWELDTGSAREAPAGADGLTEPNFKRSRKSRVHKASRARATKTPEQRAERAQRRAQKKARRRDERRQATEAANRAANPPQGAMSSPGQQQPERQQRTQEVIGTEQPTQEAAPPPRSKRPAYDEGDIPIPAHDPPRPAQRRSGHPAPRAPSPAARRLSATQRWSGGAVAAVVLLAAVLLWLLLGR
jgi:hypothetical protein